ncbi:terminase small subunit [Mycobacterium phage Nebkiss]|nr:terminase small subunit [Mycobacterium phage Nebkiss]
MAARGVKPSGKPTLFRGEAMTEWVEVENVPFEGAPELPRRSPAEVKVDGDTVMVTREWPEWALRKWRVWSSMPHCALWMPADWEHAFDCLEVAAEWIEKGGPGLATELRNREKRLGVTAEDRRDLRIRYVEPQQDKPKLTVVENDFRDL